MIALSDFKNYLFSFVGRALRSIWRWLWVSTVICIVVALAVNILWFYDFLGEECRYYGDRVERCYFMSVNMDSLAGLLLTPWVLPVIGPFAAFLMPLVMGPVITSMIWPFYYAAKLGLCGLFKFCRRSKDKAA